MTPPSPPRGSPEALRRVDALLAVGLRLARSAPSGRILLAQLAVGIDPGWFPTARGQEIVAELEAARRAVVVPLAADKVQQILRRAWGGRPADELDDLDPEPAAVTPTSQVHRGVLDGSAVAVKVLRPGIARAVRQDLALLDSLLGPLGAAFPAIDARAILREVSQRVLDELDLEHEAGAQRRFHRALRGHRRLIVPAPVTRLCHSEVLVCDWVDGVSLDDAPDLDRAAASLIEFGLGCAAAGIMHADLSPENVRVMPDARLAILDFGAWCEVQAPRLALVTAAVQAFLASDLEALVKPLTELGWLPEAVVPSAVALAQHTLGELACPGQTRLDRDAVLAAGRRLRERTDQAAAVIQAGAITPADLWPLRAAAQLFGTIARVGATGDWPALVQRALRDGIDADR